MAKSTTASSSVEVKSFMKNDTAETSRESATSIGVDRASGGAPVRRKSSSAAVPAHRTVRLRPRTYDVPSLSHLCVQKLAEHADSIVDLKGVGEDSALKLLREIMGRKKLTYPLAKVFMEAGHDELSSALATLNLWDAIPVGRNHYERRCSDYP